jgi:hypothetical protein
MLEPVTAIDILNIVCHSRLELKIFVILVHTWNLTAFNVAQIVITQLTHTVVSVTMVNSLNTMNAKNDVIQIIFLIQIIETDARLLEL